MKHAERIESCLISAAFVCGLFSVIQLLITLSGGLS